MDDDELVILDEAAAQIKSLTDMVEYTTNQGMTELAASTQKELDALILKKQPAPPPSAKEAAISLSAATTEDTHNNAGCVLEGAAVEKTRQGESGDLQTQGDEGAKTQ